MSKTTRATQALSTATGDRARVARGIDDACDTRLNQRERAWAGATEVVARLERYDRRRPARLLGCELRQRVDFGMRGAAATVPAGREHVTCGGKDDSSDLRVDAAGPVERERQRLSHGGVFCGRKIHGSSLLSVVCQTRAERRGNTLLSVFNGSNLEVFPGF